MPANSIQNAIRQTCARLLEDWAMMLVDEVPAESFIFEPETKIFETEIDFNGIFNGKFTILAQEDFAVKLVENIIGENEGEETQRDALKEMANVFAGNLLTSAFGTDLVFDLNSPQCVIKNEIKVDQIVDKRTFCFMGDDAPVVIKFSLNS